MSEVLLINPRSRRRKSTRRKTASRKRRAPARRAAPARRRRRNPARVIRRDTIRRAARRVTRRRRNPSARGIIAQMKPAVTGAVGAVVTDLAYRFLPTPGPLAMLKGNLAPVTRIGVAFGAAWLAKMVAGRKTANEMLNGALTVIAYGLANEHLLSRLPIVGVGEYMSGIGYQDTAQAFVPGMTALPDSGGDWMDYESATGVGEYISGF